jgi:hypothetical protein
VWPWLDLSTAQLLCKCEYGWTWIWLNCCVNVTMPGSEYGSTAV